MVENLFAQFNYKPTMLVLGMPRTGTKTMLHFLHANYRERYDVCHSHGLSDQWINVLRDHWADSPKSNGDERGEKWIEEKLASRTRTLSFMKHSPFLVVFVTIRDPIARAYSAMVYRHEALLKDEFDNDTNTFRDINAVRTLVDRSAREEFEVQQAWFDRELRRQFGLDVLAHNCREWPVILSAKRMTAVLVKCEQIDRMINEIRQKVPGGERIAYEPKNSSVQRQTKTILDAVIAHAPICPRLLKQMYRLPEVRQFYTIQELVAFESQWQRCAA